MNQSKFEDPWASIPDEHFTAYVVPQPGEDVADIVVGHLEQTLLDEPWCDTAALDALNSMREESVNRRLARNKINPDDPAEPAEWQGWLERERHYALARGDEAAIRTLDVLAQQSPPTAHQFAHAQLAFRQAGTIPQSMSREVRQIAGILDITPEAAQEVFLKARSDYITSGSRETPPTWHTEGLTASYRFGDAIKHPPTDPATQWALHAALTDPARSSHIPRRNAGYVVFDTETNGLDSTADILSITIRQYDNNGTLVDELSTYVKPPRGADGTFNLGDEKCRSIHGITTEHVSTAPTFAELGGRVHELMAGRTLIGHNIVTFDIPKVQAALARNGHDPLPRSPMVDTLRLARWKQPNPGVPSKEWRHTLEHACKRAGVPFDANLAHDASYDVDRSHALYRSLTGRSDSTTGKAAA